MAIYTLRSGVDNHPEDSVLQQLTDIVRKGGLVNPSTDFLVSEPGGGGLNVDVADGSAYVKSSTSNCYPVRNTATETVAINSNSSGNPRITSIVLYIDLVSSPDPTGGADDVAKLIAVDGAPAGSPVAPNSSAIQSAIGANDPYLVLANITVANGATGISSENISNIASRVFFQSISGIYEMTFNASQSIDYLNGNKQRVIATDDVTFSAPSNMEIGDSLMIIFTQDAGGTNAITWFSGITWLSPDYGENTDGDAVSVFTITKTGSSSYLGFMAGKEY